MEIDIIANIILIREFNRMKVIIVEKPSVAKNIVDALKIKTKKEGYFEGIAISSPGLSAIYYSFTMQKIAIKS